LEKSEEVRRQQKDVIYSMRKEMQDMQKQISELNEIKESGLLGNHNSTFISNTQESS
jgi:hypothetical protein